MFQDQLLFWRGRGLSATLPLIPYRYYLHLNRDYPEVAQAYPFHLTGPREYPQSLVAYRWDGEDILDGRVASWIPVR